MYPNDERPPAQSRASYHAPGHNGETGRLRLLDGAEDNAAVGAYPKTGFGKLSWALTCSLVLLLGAGSVLWPGSAPEKLIVRADPVQTEPVPEADVAEYSARYADEIGEEITAPMPVQSTSPSPPVVAESSGAQEGKENAPTAKTPNQLKRKSISAAKPASKPKLVKIKPPKPAPVTAASPPADVDLALLSALVAHAKATQPKAALPDPGFKQCRAKKGRAAAERCVARLCAGAAKGSAECLPVSAKSTAKQGPQ